VQGQNKPEPKDLWQEPFVPASAWRPCADQRNWEASGESLSLSLSLHICIYVSVFVCMSAVYVFDSM
jgi:hypothetical protein